MNNFYCPNKECGTNEVSVPSFTIAIRNGVKVFLYRKTPNQVVCSDCGTPLAELKTEVDFSTINFGKFESMSPSQKQDVLRKRSKEHFKKEIAERKVDAETKLKNHLLNK